MLLGQNERASYLRTFETQVADQKMRIGNWEIVSELSQGRWSRVALAVPYGCQSNRADYVIKYVNPESPHAEFARSMLAREYACAKLVTHPCLISFLDADLERDAAYLVSARHSGETLQRILADLKYFIEIGEKLSYFRQLCEAVRALHRLNIRHGDLSPSNLILDLENHRLVVVDLGLSEQIDPFQRHSESYAGTFGFIAPECYTGKDPVGLSADVYSMGRLMLEFAGDGLVGNGNPTSRFSQVHFLLQELLVRMTQQNPLRRPSLDEVFQQVAELEIRCLEVDYRAVA